ncbi:MAG: hypothetical protein N3A55_08025 [Methylohalobius sp.]|nr:hypothetical protein [Methylohalobius sp.]
MGTRLALDHTPEEAAYGTQAMAEAVMEQVRNRPEQGIIVMQGHRDGILAYAGSPRRAALLIIETLAKVWFLELSAKQQ